MGMFGICGNHDKDNSDSFEGLGLLAPAEDEIEDEMDTIFHFGRKYREDEEWT